MSIARLILIVSIASSALGAASTLRVADAAQSSPSWTVRDLGTLGGRESWATSVNTAGMVVGASRPVPGSAPTHAFLWQDGEMADLGTLGGTFSTAVAINGRGQVIGMSGTRSHELHAFIWDNGQMRDLGTLGESSASRPTAPVAINERGEVAGTSYVREQDGSGGATHAFLWRAGEMTDLGTLGGKWSVATALNDRGEVVGQSTTRSRAKHAFLWTAGKMIDLGARPGDDASSADAVNNRGQVVGRSERDYDRAELMVWERGRVAKSVSVPIQTWNVDINERGEVAGYRYHGDWLFDDPSTVSEHAFVWRSGRVIDLKPFAGRRSEALALGDDGSVVGWASTVDCPELVDAPACQGHAFVWNNGPLIDLGTLGGLSSEAAAIAGPRIAGWSLRGGAKHAALWTQRG
jgi:probable HAF family extracellular repeat protein